VRPQLPGIITIIIALLVVVQPEVGQNSSHRTSVLCITFDIQPRKKTHTGDPVATTASLEGGGFFEYFIRPLRWLFQSRPMPLNAEADTRCVLALQLPPRITISHNLNF
jgi:hypothetical protein